MALGKRSRGGRSRAGQGARKRTRRTYARKPMMTRSIGRNIGSAVHTFKRWLSGGQSGGALTIIGNTAYAPYVSNLTFNLDSIVAASEFGNLFDQYRILTAVTKFWLKIDPGAQTAANSSYPKMYWYRDYDDSANPSNLNEMRQNGRCKIAVMYPNRPVTIVIKPNTLGLVYQSTVTNQTEPKWRQWLDCTNLFTPHYGAKYAIDDLTNTNYKVEVEVCLYFQCRNTR